MDPEQQRLINEAARIVNEIDQIFIDVDYWNTRTRPKRYPSSKPINPDPKGQMQRARRQMRNLLANEAALGNYPSVVPLTARPRRYIPVAMTDAVRAGLVEDENKN